MAAGEPQIVPALFQAGQWSSLVCSFLLLCYPVPNRPQTHTFHAQGWGDPASLAFRLPVLRLQASAIMQPFVWHTAEPWPLLGSGDPGPPLL